MVRFHLLLAVAALIPIRELALRTKTAHVQGIDTDGVHLWVTSVERATRKGFLQEFVVADGKLLRTLAMVKKGGNPSTLLLQALMLLRRTPMGMLEMFLLRNLLAGEGRLFGMDLASRRQALQLLMALATKLAAGRKGRRLSPPRGRRRLRRRPPPCRARAA